MPIAFWVVAVVAVLGAVFSNSVRDAVENMVVTTWNVGAYVLRQAFILWVVLIGLATFVGAMTGSWVAGLFLGISVPFCFFLLFWSPGFRKFTIWTGVACVGIAGVLFTIGVISPKFKKSLNRWTGGYFVELANRLDKDTVKSEAVNGVKALSNRKAPVYSPDALVVMTHTKEDKNVVVKVLSLEADKDGLLPVMLENDEGNYIGGMRGRMVVDDLDFNYKSTAIRKGESEIHCVKVVMNDPNGVRVEVPKPGRYLIWAEYTPRLQWIDGRMMEVWPDGRTSDQVTGGFAGHKEGHYDRMSTQNQNPIPGASTFALTVSGAKEIKAFPGRGMAVEVEVVNFAVIDTNIPAGWKASYLGNKGENTVYYQRLG